MGSSGGAGGTFPAARAYRCCGGRIGRLRVGLYVNPGHRKPRQPLSNSRRSGFKKMQIVRGCDVKRNVLVYMVYSDKLIEGSPKNSTSSVPIMPWGANAQVEKCGDWIEG